MEIFVSLIDKYGPQTALMIFGAVALREAIMFGLRFLSRLADAKAEYNQTESSHDRDQTHLAFKALEISDEGQKRLEKMQANMLLDQQNNQQVMHKWTNEITTVTLTLARLIKELEQLVASNKYWLARIIDWDERLALFMRDEAKRRTASIETEVKITTLLNTILSKITGKDMPS